MQRLKTSAARQFKKRKLPRFEMIFDDSDGVEALITASRHPIEEEEEEKEDEFLVINTRQRDSNDGSVDEGSTAHEHPPALMRHLGLKEAHAHLLGDLSFHDLLQLHRTGKLVRLVCERDARAGRRPGLGRGLPRGLPQGLSPHDGLRNGAQAGRGAAAAGVGAAPGAARRGRPRPALATRPASPVLGRGRRRGRLPVLGPENG